MTNYQILEMEPEEEIMRTPTVRLQKNNEHPIAQVEFVEMPEYPIVEMPTEQAIVEMPTITLEAILSRIAQIGSLDRDKQKSALRNELGETIGDIDRTTHLEIEDALLEHIDMTRTVAKEFIRNCRASAKERKKAAKAAAQKETTAERTLPVIQVNNRQLRDIEDDAYQAIVTRNESRPTEPCVYVRGGELQWIRRNEKSLNGASRIGIHTVQLSKFISLLGRCADWVVIDDDDGEKDATPHILAIQSVFNLGEWPDLPPLNNIVRCPLLGPDKKIHAEPGYNAGIFSYYADPIELGDTTPTKENLASAKDLILNNLLGEFPFEDNASKAHAVALLLLPFVRPLIKGATPLHLIDAPTPGSGKGLLTDVCAIPSTGQESVPAMTAPEDESEWSKSLTAAFLQSRSHISIDNIKGELSSAALSKFLTQASVSERILGESTNVELDIRATWVANGNNIFVDTDMARRCVWIRLSPTVECPWTRDGFRHKELRAWALQNRPALATAVITMIQKWLDDGAELQTGKPKGSFASWAGVIGGILASNGIEGFLENEEDLYKSSAESAEAFKAFVAEWYNEHGCKKTSVVDLFFLASYTDEVDLDGKYKNLLEDLLGSGKERGRRIRLGNELRKSIGKVFELADENGQALGSFKIVKCARTSQGNRWQLDNMDDEAGAL